MNIWLDKVLPGLALAVGLFLVAVVTVPLPDSRREGWRRRWAGRALYALTVVNPIFSVLADDYTFVRDAQRSYALAMKRKVPTGEQYSERLRQLVTGVGAVKPRRLFVVGAVLRGLQLHSPLRRLFDPPASFGVGVNMLALFDGVAWPASFLLGWAVSAPWWRLGAYGSRPTARAVDGVRQSTARWWQRIFGEGEGTAEEEAVAAGRREVADKDKQKPTPVYESDDEPREAPHGLLLQFTITRWHMSGVWLSYLALTNRLRTLRWMLLLMLARTRLKIGPV